MVKFGNDLKILKFLIEHNKEEFSIRSISNILKIDYKNTYLAIEKLRNSINLRKQSGSNFISFKPILTSEQYLAEKYRFENILKIKKFKIIVSELSKLNEQFILLLFGSYAKRKQTKDSDIDLLLISNNDKMIKAQLEILPLPIHITSITNDDFHSMLLSKEFSVISEATDNNIILFGIESYYRFIGNVAR